eukprot:m.188930 g.188930  ORF g.188930 m.188930 type:complete len:115 (-) comp18197_c0_seq4:66-410(-)
MQDQTKRLGQAEFGVRIKVFSGKQLASELDAIGISKTTVGTIEAHVRVLCTDATQQDKSDGAVPSAVITPNTGMFLRSLVLTLGFYFRDLGQHVDDYRLVKANMSVWVCWSAGS